MPNRLRTVLALAAAAVGVALGSTAGAKEDAHLEWRKTYGEALLESRIRNVPVFVSRHKDG